jgi:hypothetical protein
MLIAGWAITILIGLYMIRDVSFDLGQADLAVRANATLGIPASVVLPIGVIGLICTILYLVPQTAALGAILLSGFVGGAVLTHLRVNGDLSDIGENVLIGVLAWSSLWLRDARIRQVLPFRRLRSRE